MLSLKKHTRALSYSLIRIYELKTGLRAYNIMRSILSCSIVICLGMDPMPNIRIKFNTTGYQLSS